MLGHTTGHCVRLDKPVVEGNVKSYARSTLIRMLLKLRNLKSMLQKELIKEA